MRKVVKITKFYTQHEVADAWQKLARELEEKCSILEMDEEYTLIDFVIMKVCDGEKIF